MFNEHLIIERLNEVVTQYGDIGLFIAMFLESSVFPVPSEVVISAAGAIGIPIKSIVIIGTIGSTLGGMVGYAIGRYAAMPVILKFGKFLFIKPHHIARAEAFALKYGVLGVLIGRLLPIIPFKVFSIAAGMTKIPFVPFVICTFIAVIPRIWILALFGAAIVQYTKPVLLGCLVVLVIFLAMKFFQQRKKTA